MYLVGKVSSLDKNVVPLLQFVGCFSTSLQHLHLKHSSINFWSIACEQQQENVATKCKVKYTNKLCITNATHEISFQPVCPEIIMGAFFIL